MSIITPKIKDDILNCLCNELPPERMVSLDAKIFCSTTGLDLQTISAVLTYFQRLGFIAELNNRGTAIFLIVNVEATDYLIRGGFTAQEELIESNINKLLLEIENLKKQLAPNQLETINKLSAIGSALLSGISLFKK